MKHPAGKVFMCIVGCDICLMHSFSIFLCLLGEVPELKYMDLDYDSDLAWYTMSKSYLLFLSLL